QQLTKCQRYAILEARVPALLAKSEKPASADELIEFAQLCNMKKMNAAAARCYADAFALKPQLAEEPGASHRYDAACFAAHAGCDRVEDGAERGDADRARWRAQARQWLRADLDAWAAKLKGSPAVDRARVHETLAWWRKDPDLAGLRDPE